MDTPSVRSARPVAVSAPQLPLPYVGVAESESPLLLADRTGRAYTSVRDDAHRKALGQYLTPPPVARFMAGLAACQASVRLLDPAAGAGALLCAVVEDFAARPSPPAAVHITAYELDPALFTDLRRVMAGLRDWAERQGVRVSLDLRNADFVLAEAGALTAAAAPSYDLVIANPPYFKIGRDDPRARATAGLVHGQPNIYSLFMALSAAMLRAGGELVFITPRSFTAGPYFARFRSYFFSIMRPLRVHLFDSRREAFGRDDVLQENLVLHAVRQAQPETPAANATLTVSTSSGPADLASAPTWRVPLADVLTDVLRLPASPSDYEVMRRVDRWPGTLRSYGLEVSTGPVVAFRATEWLRDKPSPEAAPLVWLNHVQALQVDWPKSLRKPQYIEIAPESRRLLVPNGNYVLLRRFSAKEERRRLTAAPWFGANAVAAWLGLENHLNYVYRPSGQLDEYETWGLATLFNSELLDRYFRCMNGNTQVGATELRVTPLPSWSAIIELGKRVRSAAVPSARIDDWLEELTTTQSEREERIGQNQGSAGRA